MDTQENSTLNCEVDNAWIHTVTPVCIYIISALGIPLNLLVLLVFLLHKKACTAAEIYLSNMAAADLFLVMFLPFWGIYVSNGYSWTFGGPMCKIVGSLISLNYNCSVYFLILVCVDRFLALVHPLSQYKLRRRKYAKMSCVVVWCFGLLLNIPALVCRNAVEFEPDEADHHIKEYTCEMTCSSEVNQAKDIVQTVVAFIIPLLIISFCTVRIFRTLEGMSDQKTERKVTFLVLAVLLAFLICWLPFQVQTIIKLAIEFKLIGEFCQHIFLYLGFFNSDLNPVLYVIVGKNFRMKMWEVLRGSRRKSTPLPHAKLVLILSAVKLSSLCRLATDNACHIKSYYKPIKAKESYRSRNLSWDIQHKTFCVYT
uniref:Bradykinin receptor B2 n=1 Tax=Neogobius melanostomus TaxID=47308 RepID=A0A8C6S7D0_9GOBI